MTTFSTQMIKETIWDLMSAGTHCCKLVTNVVIKYNQFIFNIKRLLFTTIPNDYRLITRKDSFALCRNGLEKMHFLLSQIGGFPDRLALFFFLIIQFIVELIASQLLFQIT